MWNVVQCAVQGRSHEQAETPCQDKTYAIYNNDIYVIALADGAGSATLSHFGAECCAKGVCELLSEQFDDYFMEEDGIIVKKNILDSLREELGKVSVKYDCSIKELASTLLTVAVHKGKYILIHIGDGVIGYLRDNNIGIASYPSNGEYINSTTFVTSGDALQTMNLLKGELNGIHGFVMMSDGTEASLYDKNKKCLAPVIRKLMKLSCVLPIEHLQHEIEISFENVIRSMTYDDCSISMLVEEDTSFQGYKGLSFNQKRKLLDIKYYSGVQKRIKRYDDILEFIIEPKTITQISEKLGLHNKYCKKYLDYLVEHNMIKENNGLYSTTVIMEK